MPQFGTASKERLATCHWDLQRLLNEVIKHVDCAVMEGHRGEADQNEAFKTGKSQKPWPLGEHNILPSMAVDVAPYPIDWKDTARFYLFIGFVKGIAQSMGIKIRCGADWDGDWQVSDQSFNDLPHIELLP